MADRRRIELLGALRLIRGESTLTRFRTQKVGVLLAYLAYFPRRPQPREVVIEPLWPETDPQSGRDNLRFVLAAAPARARRNSRPRRGTIR